MTVAELIEFLKTQPQDLPVAYKCYSERMSLEIKDIHIERCCAPRADGWVPNERPDKDVKEHLVFPGN